MTDYQPLENYGIIGDLNTVALVGINGSIDFMCFPEFDSPSIFAALLDKNKGGNFQITPQMRSIRYKQMYLPDTNVLISRFLSKDGVGEIIDFMPISGFAENCLVRKVKSIRGTNTFHLHCAPRFNYALSSHTTSRHKKSLVFEPESKNIILTLEGTVPLTNRQGDGYAVFTLKPGESAEFVFGHLQDNQTGENLSESVDRALFDTIKYWRTWISNSQYNGRWQEVVNRSALLLKLLTSKKYGSMVASPTFGLPEHVGSYKNWDYRFTWIRDAAFSIYALIRLGFTKEAGAFINWYEKMCPDVKNPGELGLMYSIRGDKKLTETVLDHFEGYRESRPVRIGNAAYEQLQLDIYGELIDSIYLYNKYGEAISQDLWRQLSNQVDWLCENWNQPDEGIWEPREGRQYFLYSRLMCWVAIDRMVRMGRNRSLPTSQKWKQVRNHIYLSIFDEFWNPARKTFVQYKGSSEVDASLLLMPLVRFIAPKDPRWLSTLKVIEEDLVSDSLVYRYKSPEETKKQLFSEGTFSLCSFWYVECLSRAGYLEKARYYLEKMLGYANHLGLYGEQIGLEGEHLGNFPQAFTHLGLISAAYNLNQNLNNARNKDIISKYV